MLGSCMRARKRRGRKVSKGSSASFILSVRSHFIRDRAPQEPAPPHARRLGSPRHHQHHRHRQQQGRTGFKIYGSLRPIKPRQRRARPRPNPRRTRCALSYPSRPRCSATRTKASHVRSCASREHHTHTLYFCRLLLGITYGCRAVIYLFGTLSAPQRPQIDITHMAPKRKAEASAASDTKAKATKKAPTSKETVVKIEACKS